MNYRYIINKWMKIEYKCEEAKIKYEETKQNQIMYEKIIEDYELYTRKYGKIKRKFFRICGT